MEEIQCFSPEVCEKIKYYVYRLIDPRDGQTFYVGKGKGNRVFAHVNDALKDYEMEEDKTNSPKLDTIRDIKKAGLNVIHLIQRWKIPNEETAYLIESAVMDCFPNLTNKQKGHHHENGIINTQTLQRDLSVKAYEEPDDNFAKYIIIKTSEGRVKYFEDSDSKIDGVYEATRSAWKLSLIKAKKYKYVLGVINGIVRGVYEVDEWMKNEIRDRIEFIGHPAPENIKNYFINKRIPDKYVKKGSANPALYKK